MSIENMEPAIAENPEEDLLVCEHCGREYPAEEGECFDNQDLCPDCLDELTSICSHCGQRIWNGDNAGSEDTVICQDCYENYYTVCEECGTLICSDDAYHADGDDDCDYCYSCYCHRRRSIHDYSYKPDPIFYPSFAPKTLYFGVELEIDQGGENSEHANELLEIGNREEPCRYIKHDGSLNDGMEIVSHPCTLDYHIHHVPWQEICRKAISLGYISHMANTAGLHIHISRSALGDTDQEQEDATARILYFVEAHFNEMLKFSRRTESQLNKWAARYGYKDRPKDLLDHAKNSNLGRYTAVNLQNYDTIEMRLFRGTLKYTSFIAALQMVSEICKAAILMSDEAFQAMSWNDFVMSIRQEESPELIEYLKTRRLYVNEEVIAEEEV